MSSRPPVPPVAPLGHPERAAARGRFAALSVAALGLGAVLPLLELRGTAALVALVAAVVATGIQFVHVARQTVGQAAAVGLALLPSVLGPFERSGVRVSAVVGGVLVYLGAELARAAHDQLPELPLEADPPGPALRPALVVAAAGGAAGAGVLLVSVINLASAAVLAVLGAVTVVVLAVAVTRAPDAADPDEIQIR